MIFDIARDDISYIVIATDTRIGSFNYAEKRDRFMPMELEHYCPSCEEYRRFWKVASTRMHLGMKVKWDCEECGHGFVRIDGAVDTGVTA